MGVSTRTVDRSANKGPATMNGAAAVQRSHGSGALADPLRDPLQASTGIFGADAIQMSTPEEECRASGGIPQDGGCHEPAALCRAQGGVPEGGSCHPPAATEDPAAVACRESGGTPGDGQCIAPSPQIEAGAGQDGPAIRADRGPRGRAYDHCHPSEVNRRAEAKTGAARTKCSMAFGTRAGGMACEKFKAAQSSEAKKCGF
jgi:hypothetical protein